MTADQDYTEFHITIKDYFTGKPYVTSDGRTSQDMPYVSCEVTDLMWEAKATDTSNAKIVFPSLNLFPHLRPLLQSIKVGNRVEIYNFQPDAGEPIFGGFIGPSDITEENGHVVLTIKDTMTQLTWQHIRRWEVYNDPASTLYKRSMGTWQDVLVDDFIDPQTDSSEYTVSNVGGIGAFSFLPNTVQIVGVGGVEEFFMYPANLQAAPIVPGDMWIFEANVNWSNLAFAAPFQSTFAQVYLVLQSGNFAVGAFACYNSTGNATFPRGLFFDAIINPTGGLTSYFPNAGTQGTAATIGSAQTHKVTCFIRANLDGTMSVQTYFDQVAGAFVTRPWNYDGTTYLPQLGLQSNGAGDVIGVTKLRARKFRPVLLPAARFNPQTADTLPYAPNYEENLQLLQLVAEKDGAEFRPIYHIWPALDELEIDRETTLGTDLSSTLGYEQAARSPSVDSPTPSPFAVIEEVGTMVPPTEVFVNTVLPSLGFEGSDILPPFRFEEGYNMNDWPKVNPKQNAYANNIVRVGSSSQESQPVDEEYAPGETGYPSAGIIGPYPNIETVINDDRTATPALVQQLAKYDLVRRTKSPGSLSFKGAVELPFTGKYRAGDKAFTKTQSLRYNYSEELRIQSIKHIAGSPEKEFVMGSAVFDASLLRLLRNAEMMSWLYDAASASSNYLTYPSTGAIGSGASSADFVIGLEQVAVNSQVYYAALHWFADANVLKLQPVFNGSPLYQSGMTSISTTDSGLQVVTQYFQINGPINWHFLNNDTVTRTLTAAFLILKVK